MRRYTIKNISMNNFNFICDGHLSLKNELGAPISRVSIRTAAHGRPISLTLWRSENIGLRIQSVMKDITERMEVGVLTFALVGSIFPDERVIQLPDVFNRSLKVTKLIIAESGVCVDSGIMLQAIDGHQITIVAGVSPFTLAIKGGGVEELHIFEPEYPLEKYTMVPMT